LPGKPMLYVNFVLWFDALLDLHLQQGDLFVSKQQFVLFWQWTLFSRAFTLTKLKLGMHVQQAR